MSAALGWLLVLAMLAVLVLDVIDRRRSARFDAAANEAVALTRTAPNLEAIEGPAYPDGEPRSDAEVRR